MRGGHQGRPHNSTKARTTPRGVPADALASDTVGRVLCCTGSSAGQCSSMAVSSLELSPVRRCEQSDPGAHHGRPGAAASWSRGRPQARRPQLRRPAPDARAARAPALLQRPRLHVRGGRLRPSQAAPVRTQGLRAARRRARRPHPRPRMPAGGCAPARPRQGLTWQLPGRSGRRRRPQRPACADHRPGPAGACAQAWRGLRRPRRSARRARCRAARERRRRPLQRRSGSPQQRACSRPCEALRRHTRRPLRP